MHTGIGLTSLMKREKGFGMPRKTPLTKEEKAIAKRLREFRVERLVSQTAFADRIGISRAQLMNYEDGLTRLPWPVVYQANRFFELNPRWLATGKLPKALRSRLHGEDPPPRAPFVEVYDRCWKKQVEAAISLEMIFGYDAHRKVDPDQTEILELAGLGWLQRVPKDRFREFLLALGAEAERIIGQINSDAR